MHEDVVASRARISRRRALGLGGAIGFGGLLAAFGIGSRGTRELDAAMVEAIRARAASDPAPGLLDKLDSIGACSLTAAEMQGPYWFDVDSIRSDIQEDRPGASLELALRVYDADCTPLPNSIVEIWHCDAGGLYSGYEVSSREGGMMMFRSQPRYSDGQYSKGVPESVPQDDGTYLRGAQVADEDGVVQFKTIYPGWYTGRAVHIHAKVHVDKANILTTQLYFDDAVTDAVHATEPYNARPDRDTRNDRDSIMHRSNIIPVERDGEGYVAYANLGVQLG